MGSEEKRFYIELTGYVFIFISIICTLITAVLAYNPAGADPSAMSMVVVTSVIMIVGIILIRFIPWGAPEDIMEKVDDDEFVF
jgi:formate-dependent nitrite reductase membrane component NrfD